MARIDPWAIALGLLFTALGHGMAGADHPGDGKPATVAVVGDVSAVTTEHGTAQIEALEVHEIHNRGEHTRVRVEIPVAAKAVAVIFPGGKGVTRIAPDGNFKSAKGNFLVRTRTYLLARSIAVVLFDGPTDHPRDLRNGFRKTRDHASDIGAIVDYLRTHFRLPVWLVGTSRGTTSVVSAASQLKTHLPDGIVLTSSMLAQGKSGNYLFEFELDAIALPVLISHHRKDGCYATLARDVPRLVAELRAAAPIAVMYYEGGEARGKPCGARGHHGFRGIEKRVVNDIVDWMLNPKPL